MLSKVLMSYVTQITTPINASNLFIYINFININLWVIKVYDLLSKTRLALAFQS